MSEFTKVAVTVPTTVYRAVERIRSRLGKSRSAAFASALETWLQTLAKAEADRQYAEGYLRTPENVDELRSTAAIATSHWSAWTPGQPSRASEASKRKPSRKGATR